MLVNNLLESSNNYKSMQEDAARLSQKWAKSGLLEGIADNRVKDNMAVILENQAKQIVAEANTTGTGGSFSAGSGEQWAGVALPLVRKVFSSIVAQDFVSVQPMNLTFRTSILPRFQIWILQTVEELQETTCTVTFQLQVI